MSQPAGLCSCGFYVFFPWSYTKTKREQECLLSKSKLILSGPHQCPHLTPISVRLAWSVALDKDVSTTFSVNVTDRLKGCGSQTRALNGEALVPKRQDGGSASTQHFHFQICQTLLPGAMQFHKCWKGSRGKTSANAFPKLYTAFKLSSGAC